MANTVHGVIITDRMSGSYNGADLVSVMFYKSSNPADIDNGNVVLVGDLVEGREIFKGTAPLANSELKDIVIIANPEIMYDPSRDLADYYVEAGTPARAFRLRSGDVFSVNAEALNYSGSIAVGNIVELMAGTKLNVVASATGSTTTIGKVIDTTVINGVTYYGIKVD